MAILRDVVVNFTEENGLTEEASNRIVMVVQLLDIAPL